MRVSRTNSSDGPHLIAVTMTAALVAVVLSRVQPRVNVAGGYGWDGTVYRDIALGVSPSNMAAYFPYCMRVATPRLSMTIADLANLDLWNSFQIVNLVFGVGLVPILFALARAANFDRRLAYVSASFGVFPFMAPLRLATFAPVYTDPGFIVFLALACLALLRKSFGIAFALLVIAALFREQAVYLLPAFLIAAIHIEGGRRPSKRLMLLFGCAVAVAAFAYVGIRVGMQCGGTASADPAFDPNQLKVAFYWATEKTRPDRFVAYVAGIAVTGAPIVFLRRVRNLSKAEIISFGGFCVAAFLTLVGGNDATRIFYGMLPMYIIALLRILQMAGRGFAAACAIAWAVTNWCFHLYEQPHAENPAQDSYGKWTDAAGFFSQFPDYAATQIALGILAIWGLAFVAQSWPWNQSHVRGKPAEGAAPIGDSILEKSPR